MVTYSAVARVSRSASTGPPGSTLGSNADHGHPPLNSAPLGIDRLGFGHAWSWAMAALGLGALPPGQTVTGQVALALAWSAAITAVFAPLAVRLYRHTVS